MNKEEKKIIELLEECIVKDLWFEINNDNATLLGSYINTLQQENKQLKEEVKEYSWKISLFASEETYERLLKEKQERIDKAIEYIKEFDIEYNDGLTYGETKHILEILKGDSNE